MAPHDDGRRRGVRGRRGRRNRPRWQGGGRPVVLAALRAGIHTILLPARNRKDLEEIARASDRAAALTRQLLAFSRKQILQPKVLDLNAIVAGIEKMVRRLIGEDVSFVTALQENVGRVKADAGQIEQVLMNLVVNARDAMPRGGRITIETRNVALRDGAYVMLAVADTGHGIDEETRAHIFEPFFTTKEIGKGTGLGLSTVYGIVTQSQGHIEVRSELDRGTVFEVYLPAVEDEIDRTTIAAAPIRSPRGSETILVVEDDDLVRGVTDAILVMNGYTVLQANSGDEALRVCKAHTGPIDLVMTDVVMPGLNGRQTAEQLLRLRPQLKLLFTSGYADDAIVRHGVLEPGTEFIQKPFAVDALAHRIRKILDAESMSPHRA